MVEVLEKNMWEDIEEDTAEDMDIMAVMDINFYTVILLAVMDINFFTF